MRSRRLATSGDGVPGAGKVGARAPGWDALARPIVSFHSGMRMRSGAPRGIESGHTRRRTSSSASTGQVSRPFAPGCAAWGPRAACPLRSGP